MGKLTALKMRSLTEPGRYSDGDGLFLEINGKGAASWILRVQNNGKRQDIGLGSSKSVSLKDARDAAFATRQKIAQGIDPVAERKQERLVIPTFRKAAELVHEEHEKAWKNGKHQNQWLATLKTYAFPKMGDLLVSEIEGPLIGDVLAPIWLAKPETARRVRQRIGTVLDWSYARGFGPRFAIGPRSRLTIPAKSLKPRSLIRSRTRWERPIAGPIFWTSADFSCGIGLPSVRRYPLQRMRSG